jgi:hypothetical protein
MLNLFQHLLIKNSLPPLRPVSTMGKSVVSPIVSPSQMQGSKKSRKELSNNFLEPLSSVTKFKVYKKNNIDY